MSPIPHNWYIFFFFFFFCFFLKGNCFTFFKKHNSLTITQKWEKDISLKIHFSKNRNKLNLKNEKCEDNFIVECGDNKNEENDKLNRNKNIINLIEKKKKKKHNIIPNDKTTKDKRYIYKPIYLNKKQKYNKKDVKKIKKILKNKNKEKRTNYANATNNSKNIQNLEKKQNGKIIDNKNNTNLNTKKKNKQQKILDMFDKDLNQSIQKLNIKTTKFEIYKNKQNAKADINENEILQKISASCKVKKNSKAKKVKKKNEVKKVEKKNEVKKVEKKNEVKKVEKNNEQSFPNNVEINNQEVANKFNIGKILKIGNSIDGFRKEIKIKNDVSKEFENQVRKLNLFSTIIDFNETLKKENYVKNEEKNYKENKIIKIDTFKNIGIYDNFINVYLKYNNINNPTFYQKKIIPIIIYFLNNGSYDLMRYTNEIDLQIQNEKIPKQIIYVNKYNKTSKHLIRTFFLHCPTGTGKTFMYLLPIFQQITNLRFSENNETKEMCNDKETKSEIFYKTKQINDITSFCCSDQLNTDLFINKNSEIIKNNVLNNSLNTSNQNNQQCGQIGDILILTYNKEVAVQIYELYKDIINSFYKSYSSKFFEINKSLTRFKYISEEKQQYLEKINILYKNKVNMNVYLLIGGNNIKYQLKNLRAKKINIIKENEEASLQCNGQNNQKMKNDNYENDNIININIYIGTPGRVYTIINEKKAINLENIHTIIFDEYDFFFNKFEKSNVKNKIEKNKIELENVFFSQILKNIYIKKKKKKRIPSITNVICCSATSAIYPYLLYTKHLITENFLTNLLGQNVKQEKINNQSTGSSPINYEKEKNIINSLFKIEETFKIPENLIHFNYCYNKKSQIKNNNNAISNFLKIIFSNPLNKNVLVFCNTKVSRKTSYFFFPFLYIFYFPFCTFFIFLFHKQKRVMDLWSLFRNRFDIDIQTIFSRNEKKKKKIFKDINYANFSKNDLINYKNLKKYVNFLFISTNLLYRGINCIGFTTIINFDMPQNYTEYVHRCGRIGRVNNKGAIFNIFEKQDKKKYIKQIFNKINIKPFDIDCYMNNIFTLKN
ncbi:ATP dependent RNA helicase, putative [Plasmodium berghei]|uniref:ATP-dependent RNA helicase n=2 Tax=Plasmodium berghei TaxID=5821 RepID=A0A509AF92_PLABA|nr:ATP-dependent RNA helicase, putative [Plasmodium berghei ANKA]CXH88647.1 ATP dependent RNA helicase, putative [Plasmodium berghei]SCL90219.1 ATP dependent RNA helicase, putative [Plasmodium berghei]VUC53969.1 ATP-dependent RNA helicase, putative [Plasmodium berghei ANKA]|eukprot:XP_034419821.1 ATP-dependent RNA helicase, putative [Plasmodium berghei ANKA]